MGRMEKNIIQTAEPVGREFVDTDGLRQMFGLKRSLAYELLWAGLIKGVSLRRPGKRTGKRLFEVQSVRDFLNGQTGLHDQKGGK